MPRILLNARLIDEMAKTTITPRAQHADKTQTFIMVVQQAMETFEDEISSLSDNIRQKAYKNFLMSYRDALTPIWNLARFTSIETVLDSIVDKEFMEMAVMAQRLKPKQPTTEVVEDSTKVPDLEVITTVLKQKFLKQSLPNKDMCAKIGDVFDKLHSARKAYATAASGLADLATLVNPDQYTMILSAAMLPMIHLVIPGNLVSSLTTPPPPQPEATTATGRSEIINFTKSKVLPNPDSTAFADIDKNLATHILAAATYANLEHQYFDHTLSRVDVATAFRCNVSQLTKAVMGVMYKSGPHHYKPKGSKTTTKRACDTTDPEPVPWKVQRTDEPITSRAVAETQTTTVVEDMLSSSSSDEELPPGLL